MSKSNTFENDFLKLIFNNTNIARIGDNDGVRGSLDAGSLYVSLHTADPGETGVQNTSETTYTSYARVAVARSGAGWVVDEIAGVNSVSPANNIDFPECTGGTATITHFGVGVEPSGAQKLLYKGTLTPNISVSTGVIPRIKSTSTITED